MKILIFLAIVAIIMHFGFWAALGGILLGLLWSIAFIAIILAAIISILYILNSL